jgi:ectoine hydroxylase-related dioxygenase (phytanoyl-CoA dioxygenase family)
MSAADEVDRDGYTVLRGVLAADGLAAASQALDRIFDDEAAVAEVRGWVNDIYRVAYLLPGKDPLFVELCEVAPVLALATGVLGPDHVVAACNGLTMTPGGRAQDLHLDQEEAVPGAALYLNVVLALDDFTAANGATRVVPGSHRRTGPVGDPASLEPDAVVVELAAGDALAYNAGLWHAGSRNRTAGLRRCVHLFFARPWVRPHWDFPASLPPEVVAGFDDERRRRFGFGSRPPRYDLGEHRIVDDR